MHFHLRTSRDQRIPPPPAVLLDWLRDGSTIQRRQNLTAGLSPPTVAVDFLRVAGAVFCADKLTVRPGTWARSLRLDVAVGELDLWSSATPLLLDALSFLSGDFWDVRPFASNEPTEGGSPAGEPVDAVCLFSGGLDSFAGAVELLAEGMRVCLVSHYEGGQAPERQTLLVRRLVTTYGRDSIVHRRLFLRPAPHSTLQERPLPEARETSTRTRSVLFFAAGLVVAAGYGSDVPLVVPENGFIGINVPLTEARSGSLSTRTTHPHFMARLRQCVGELGLTNPVINPFRVMTKGELLAASRDTATLYKHAPETLSCAHPEAPRFAKRAQGNCGYCFPCLVRRAALHHVGLDNGAHYAFDALNEPAAMAGERGADLRAILRSLNRSARPIDVLRNGPVLPADLPEFARVYASGRAELLAWLRAWCTSPMLLSQLPPQ